MKKHKFSEAARLATTFAVLFQQLVGGSLAFAQDGAVVVGGAATIAQQGADLNVITHTDRTVINWDSFNISAGHTANFNQPGVNSAVLNRVVTPNNPSGIYGTLNSNGNVYLVNPSGVVVGPSGVINTNGFTASVLDISNKAFLDGGPLQFSGSSDASIVNQGTIHTGNGGVALIGGQVINEGLIKSDGGSINLLTGGTVQLNAGGTYTQADQDTIQNGISQTAGLIRNSGTLRATGALEVGGEVYLVSPGGTVLQEGLIAASKQDNAGGETGGKVVVTGDAVELKSATIDASGTNGGLVLIGGDFGGKNPGVPNTQATSIDVASTINAGSTPLGSGGRVSVWGTDEVHFHGNIDTLGGDGGFVEISTHGIGVIDGSAQTLSLLIDPGDVVVSTAGTSGGAPGAVEVTAATITGVLNLGGLFELETDVTGTTGPGRVDFGGGGSFVVNNDTGTLGTFRIHAADEINTQQVGFMSTGTTGTNYEFYAGSTTTGSPQATADVVMNGQEFNSGGGNVLFDAADDVSIFDPLRTGGGNATLISRGGDAAATVNIGRALDNNDDRVDTSDGSGNAGAVFIKTDVLNVLSTATPFINAAGLGGSVTIHRASSGDVSLGVDNGGLFISQPTLENINTVDLVIGDANAPSNRIRDLFVSGVDTSSGNTTGTVHLNSLDFPNHSDVFFSGTNAFSSLDAKARGDVEVTDGTVTTTTGDMSFHAGFYSGVTELFDADIRINGDLFTTGNSFQGIAKNDINFSSDGDLTTLGGNVSLNTLGQTTGTSIVSLGAGSTISTVGGAGNAGTVLIEADGLAVTLTGVPSINAAGTGGAVTIQRATNGNISLGDNNGGFHISQATLASIDAETLNVGGNNTEVLTAANFDPTTSTISDLVSLFATAGSTSDILIGPADGAFPLFAEASDTITFSGAVGAIAPLASLTARAGGVIDVNAPINVSGGGINLLSESNINFNASVQNTVGETSLVAGWDGVTTDIATILSDDSKFGISNGSVFIGNNATTTGVAVGSRFGTTNVAADSLTLQGSNGTGGGFAQLGFHDTATITSIGGAINVALTGDLTAKAGTRDGTYTQVGHGWIDTTGDSGNYSGDIAITVANDVTFSGGDGRFTYSQLGHGGEEASGNHSGAIALTAGGNLELAGGSNRSTYAQIGHGYVGSHIDGTRMGAIDVRVTGEISLVNGTGPGTGADWLIGHNTTTVNGISSADVTLLTGTLDYDSAATSTLFDISDDANGADFAAKMIGNLAGGHVTLAATNGTAGTTGGMSVTSPFAYDSTNNLTLISTADIRFDASVQNRNDTSGDINIVAGWDGITVDPAAFATADVTSTTLFGNNMGSVFVGTGSQATGVAVGSRSGDTRVFGYDVALQGGQGSGAFGRFAQLGFQVSDGVAQDGTTLGVAPVVNGDITVHTTNDITATGGNSFLSRYAYAQIGHVGADQVSDTTQEAAATSNIRISAAGDIAFTGGNGPFAYAQIGQGGFYADGDHNGTTTITHARDITFRGGGGRGTSAYAQLGQGGSFADGNHEGTTTITHARDITFKGNSSNAQLGQGGVFAFGDHKGTTKITHARDITFEGGREPSAYSLLGQGGNFAEGNHDGITTITVARDVTIEAGTGFRAYAQLGQGGYGADGSHSGTIAVSTTGDLIVARQSPVFFESYAGVGHGDDPADLDSGHTVFGDIMLRIGGNADLTNAFVGHQIEADGTYTSGNTYVGVGGNLTTNAASQFNSARTTATVPGQLRIYLVTPANDMVHAATTLNGVAHGATTAPNNQGTFAFGAGPYIVPGTDVAAEFNYYTLPALYNYTVDADEAAAIVAALGTGGVTLASDLGQIDFGAFYDWDGGTQFIDIDSAIAYSQTNPFSMLATGPVNFNASVQNGHATGGDVNIVAGWDGVTFSPAAFATADVTSTTLFGNNAGSVFIGSDSATAGVAVGSAHGTTNVLGHDLILRGSDSDLAYAQLGFHHVSGGTQNSTITTGDINVLATGGVSATGGSQGAINDVSSYVQIGHGGNRQESNDSTAWNYTGDVALAVNENITFQAGSEYATYALLGNGGFRAFGSHNGNHAITQAHDITFHAGSGVYTYAQLGNGAYATDGSHSGNHTITQANDIKFKGGTFDFAYAQLGNGGYSATGSHNGNHTITQANHITFEGGSEYTTYAQLGNGGSFARGHHTGNHTITQANDIRFKGGSGFWAYAQLGNAGVSATGSHNGNHTITHVNDITFRGGTNQYAYAQLGNGGHQTGSHSGSYRGSHTIELARDITFQAGSSNYAYAQLGNGGYDAVGSHSGNHSIDQVRDMIFQANGIQAYAQLGNGGYRADGSHSGTIDVTTDGNLVVTGQNTTNHYAIIGHGDEPGDGDIGDTVAGDVTLRIGGNADLTDAFIGHQTDEATGYTSGNTFLGVVGDLTADATSQVNSASNNSPDGELRIYLGGSDLVNTATLLNGTAHGATPFPNDQGNHVFSTGPYPNPPTTGNFAYYHIQQGLYNYTVDTAEAAAIVAALGTGGVTLASDLDQPTFGSFYDWDGGTQFIDINSPVAYDANHSFTMAATGPVNFNASVQNRNDTGGDINVVAGWDGMTTDPAAFATADVTNTTLFGNNMGSVFVGDGSQATGVAVGSRSGDTHVFGYDVALQGGTGAGIDRRFAQLGFQVTNGIAQDGTDLDVTSNNGANVIVDGDITAYAVNDLFVTGGDTSEYNYAQVGHVGADPILPNYNTRIEAAADSLIELMIGQDVSFMAGDGTAAYAQLGHGGYGAFGDHNGTTSLNVEGNISFVGGGGNSAYSQLGQGGLIAEGNHSGDATITLAHDITFTAGSGDRAYAQLGQGGHLADGDHSGNTEIKEALDITFSGGTNVRTYAQLGNGGYNMSGSHSGDLTITLARDITFSGGSTAITYAQLGHGGDNAIGSHSGTTTITEARDITFSGGIADFDEAYAQLGHGGYGARGSHSGATIITLARDITFQGGETEVAYAQLGHGGYNAKGNHSGTTAITEARDITFLSGNTQIAYAQLGHGGWGADGSHSGSIDLTASGDLVLTGKNTTHRYAIIGHGDNPDGDAGHTVSGDVTLSIGGAASLTNGFIGHRIDASGTYAIGNTFLSIGGNNFTGTNLNNKLTSDANSGINSAPNSNGGQLRLYLPRRDSLNMANGATLNGVDVATLPATGPLPNEQGDFAPFTGPYSVDLADGNFAFYFPTIDLIVNANSGSSTYGDTPVNPGQTLTNGTLNAGETLGSIGLVNSFNLTATSNAGTYVLTVDDSSLDPVYNLAASSNGSFTINPAALTIAALNTVKPLGTTGVPDGTTDFATIGLKNGETIGSVTLASTGYPSTAGTGVYPIIITNPVGGTFDPANYDITLVNGNLLVALAGSGISTYDEFIRYIDFFATVQSLLNPTGPPATNNPATAESDEENNSPNSAQPEGDNNNPQGDEIIIPEIRVTGV